MRNQKFVLVDDMRKENAKAAIDSAEFGQVVTIRNRSRSLEQNALLHLWFGEVARQSEGETLISIKGQAHRKYAVPIKLASDEKFAWVWKQTGALMDYERQCKFLASGVLNISSGMTKAELQSYLDAFSKDYRGGGICFDRSRRARVRKIFKIVLAPLACAW